MYAEVDHAVSIVRSRLGFIRPVMTWLRGDGWVQIGILVLLVALVVLPLVILFWVSLLPPGQITGGFSWLSLQNYSLLINSAQFIPVWRNTILYAAGAGLIAIVIGGGVAWLTERSDLAGRSGIRVAMFGWMGLPAIVVAFGWILIANPGNGVLITLFTWLTGRSLGITIYSIWSMTLISGLVAVPTAFVMLTGLLRNMDPQLEFAGAVHGGTRLGVTRRISIPILAPGLVSVAIVMFMGGVQAFDIPIIIGLNAKAPVLSTQIYLLTYPQGSAANYGLAASSGVGLLCLALVLMTLYFAVARTGERYKIVTGKGFRLRRVRLGYWRYVAGGLLGLYFLVMLLPVMLLLWASFLPFYQPPSIAALSLLTLDSYDRIFADEHFPGLMFNTLILVLASATAVMAISTIIGWLSTRRKTHIVRAIEFLSFAPIAVPPLVLALAILLLYLRTPFYGTLLILIIGHMTIYIAFGTRTMTAAIMQIHGELESAAIVSGATKAGALVFVLLPLIRTQFLNGWLWVAAHSVRDLTIPLMLLSATNAVLVSEIWRWWELPDLPTASALSMIILAMSIMIIAPAQIWLSRNESTGG